jgi:4-hydroxybenzoate polyprenyltransferase
VAYFRTWRYGLTEILVLFTFMYFGWVATGGGLTGLDARAVRKVILGWAAATATLMAVFLVNDAADSDIDRVVHPERAIPQGRSAPGHIYAFGLGLLVLAVAASFAINRRSVLVAGAMAVMAVVHYGYAKRRLSIPCSSELITPIMSALFPLYALSVAENHDLRITVFLMGFIYLADLAQDMLGGIHDQPGDRMHNVRTFAIALGGRPTLYLSLAFFLGAVLYGVLLYIRGPLGVTYFAALTGLTVFMLYRYLRLFRANSAALPAEAKTANHLAGGYFFLVSASTFVDFIVRSSIR